MQIDISCQHTSLTDGLREAINEKFSKLANYTNDPITVHVTLSVAKHLHRVEAKVLVKGRPYDASHQSRDMYRAIDEIIPKIRRMMRKHKTEVEKRSRQTKETIRRLDLSPLA